MSCKLVIADVCWTVAEIQTTPDFQFGLNSPSVIAAILSSADRPISPPETLFRPTSFVTPGGTSVNSYERHRHSGGLAARGSVPLGSSVRVGAPPPHAAVPQCYYPCLTRDARDLLDVKVKHHWTNIFRLRIFFRVPNGAPERCRQGECPVCPPHSRRHCILCA